MTLIFHFFFAEFVCDVVVKQIVKVTSVSTCTFDSLASY